MSYGQLLALYVNGTVKTGQEPRVCLITYHQPSTFLLRVQCCSVPRPNGVRHQIQEFRTLHWELLDGISVMDWDSDNFRPII